MCDRDSFDSLRSVWLPDLKQRAQPNVTVAIVANKADIVGGEGGGGGSKVSESEIAELVEESGAIIHKEVSAKKN